MKWKKGKLHLTDDLSHCTYSSPENPRKADLMEERYYRSISADGGKNNIQMERRSRLRWKKDDFQTTKNPHKNKLQSFNPKEGRRRPSQAKRKFKSTDKVPIDVIHNHDLHVNFITTTHTNESIVSNDHIAAANIHDVNEFIQTVDHNIQTTESTVTTVLDINHKSVLDINHKSPDVVITKACNNVNEENVTYHIGEVSQQTCIDTSKSNHTHPTLLDTPNMTHNRPALRDTQNIPNSSKPTNTNTSKPSGFYTTNFRPSMTEEQRKHYLEINMRTVYISGDNNDLRKLFLHKPHQLNKDWGTYRLSLPS